MNSTLLSKQKIAGKNVLIIGPPASGKTSFANQLGGNVVHTDDYIKHGYEQALYVMMFDLVNAEPPLIIEGVLGYRLLRKIAQTNFNWKPDLVIELQISKERQQYVYQTERDPSKLRYLQSFAAAHAKILDDYFQLVGDNRPEWIKYNYMIPAL